MLNIHFLSIMTSKNKHSNFAKLIGKNISERRIKLGYSQSELARKVGMYPGTISRLESGVTPISVLRCSQFAEIFGISVNDLISPYSPQTSDQALVVQKLIEQISDKNRIFLIKMIEEWVEHFNTLEES